MTPRVHRLLAAALSILASFGVAAAAAAQVPRAVVVDSLAIVPLALAPRDRIERAEALVAADEESYGIRWKAAETYAEVGLSEPDADTREEMWRRGHEHATVATALDPQGIDAHYWRAVIAGLLADVTGGRTKVRFGDEVYRESAWVLAADSLHAGAHFLQGRVHAGVMRLSSVMRFLAKLLVGGDALANASWEKAEYHLRRAAELQPDLPMHHFELAMTYEARGWPDHMDRALRSTFQASTSTPFQDGFKVRAREIPRQREAR